MNIDDVSTDELQIPLPHEVFQHIFARQQSLITRYIDIERRNGFHKPDLNLLTPPLYDDAQFQNWMKNTFWRTTEELAEAMEVFPDLSGDYWSRWETDYNLRHFYEEIIDAVHFFVEVTIYLQVPHESCSAWLEAARLTLSMHPHGSRRTEVMVREAMFDFILKLGLSANCLKNKPWKSSHMETDVNRFRRKFCEAWHAFAILMALVGLDHEKLYRLYFRKNEVNAFRQKSNY